jgi:hypothetical protein
MRRYDFRIRTCPPANPPATCLGNDWYERCLHELAVFAAAPDDVEAMPARLQAWRAFCAAAADGLEELS